MAKQEYDAGDNSKVVHVQKEHSNTPHGDTTQHDVYVSDKGEKGHMHIWHERSYSTGGVRSGGHGENFRNNSSSSDSESSGSGK